MAETGSIVAFIIAVAIVLIIAKLAFKSTRSFYGILVNSALGVFALWILDVVGYGVPITWITAGLVGLLGVPGVVVLVVMRYILNII